MVACLLSDSVGGSPRLLRAQRAGASLGNPTAPRQTKRIRPMSEWRSRAPWLRLRSELRERPVGERPDSGLVRVLGAAHEKIRVIRRQLDGENAHQRPGAEPGVA